MTADTYSTAQRTGHWLVVALVAFQFFTGDGMARAFHSVADGSGMFGGAAWVHGMIGSIILITMLARLGLRVTRGAPPPPANESATIQKVSRGNHYLFYVVLIAMPLAGMFAVFTLNETIAAIHSWTSTLLLVLIAAHIAGAIWHMSKRDGVIQRMIGRVT